MNSFFTIGLVFICWTLVFLLKKSTKIKEPEFKRFVLRYKYILHPNAITLWGTALAIVSMVLYFYQFPRLATSLFVVASFVDSIDGTVARSTGLVTKLGKEIDPFCDKVKYFIPLLYFTYKGFLFVEITFFLILIDVLGQLARRVAKTTDKYFNLNVLVAANHYGKLKTILALLLVVYCSLLEQGSWLPNVANYVLVAVTALAFLSMISKFRKTTKTDF